VGPSSRPCTCVRPNLGSLLPSTSSPWVTCLTQGPASLWFSPPKGQQSTPMSEGQRKSDPQLSTPMSESQRRSGCTQEGSLFLWCQGLGPQLAFGAYFRATWAGPSFREGSWWGQLGGAAEGGSLRGGAAEGRGHGPQGPRSVRARASVAAQGIRWAQPMSSVLASGQRSTAGGQLSLGFLKTGIRIPGTWNPAPVSI